MKKLLYIPFFLILFGFNLHKYYVSVTEIAIKKDKLEIIMRVFPDDMENVLKDTYQISPDLASKETLKYVKFYLKQKFQIFIDDKEVDYKFVGFLMDDGFFVVLMEVAIPNELHVIRVKNRVLQDFYDEQKNIVHIIWGDKKESFILTKKDNKAIFKL